MSKKLKDQRLHNSQWLRASLMLLAGLVLLFLRSRSQQRSTADQPVVWRRDIEMGPESGKAAPVSVGEQSSDMRAGEGESAGEPGQTAARSKVGSPVPTQSSEEMQTPTRDDLEVVEGIGPKINTILQTAGIRTFAELAGTSVEKLEEILRLAGLRRINNPTTWPEQARLAAAAEWSKLETFQGQLKAGRKVS